MTEEVPGESSKERGVRKALTGDKSEFGEGVVIPLVYLAAHLDNDQAQNIRSAAMGGADVSTLITTHMNGASDHLYGFQIPGSFPAELKAKMEALREKALRMGHGFDGTTWTIADYDSIWEMTKAIALDIDRQVLGIDDADEGEYD